MARGTWAALTALLLCLAMSTAQAQDPKMRDIGKKPPRGAIVLFDGKSGAAWKHRGTNAEFSWRIVDGAMEVTPGYPDIVTKSIRYRERDARRHAIPQPNRQPSRSLSNWLSTVAV